MSLGGNFSSGYTDSLTDKMNQAHVVKSQSIAYSDNCPSNTLDKSPAARYPSMVLSAKQCPPVTPADFAKYPKVAVPSSVRTEALATGSLCPKDFNHLTRFAQYQRYQVPVPCAPLPASANMAGISQPSSRACNL